VNLERAGLGSRSLLERMLTVILAEESYRKERGYPSVLDPHGDNEAYVHRAGVLKKFCSSALFLEIERGLARRTWQEVFFAIAAGIAMAFATLVALWAQARYSGLPLRLLLIFVVAYMFKDRLKEAFRTLFSGFLARHFWDRSIVIEDPLGGVLGRCREKIEYVKAADLPKDVRIARAAVTDPASRLVEEELTETITHYKKELILDGDRLATRQSSAITDILRFHVARLTREMDEQYQTIDWVDRETFQLTPLKGAKVYHVDVVLRFTARGETTPVTTVKRLIVDRRGIKRLAAPARRPSANLTPLPSALDDE
jgi:hypothetical protein